MVKNALLLAMLHSFFQVETYFKITFFFSILHSFFKLKLILKEKRDALKQELIATVNKLLVS